MPDYSTKAPGVYLKEVAGTRVITGVGTAMPAFLGLAPSGPMVPTFVANWTQYVDTFGGIHEGMGLGRAVYAYIANGGSGAMVVRVGGGDGADGGDAHPARATLQTETGDDALVLTAKLPGGGGDQVAVEVSDTAPAPAPDAATGGGDDAAAPEPAEAPQDRPFDLVLRAPEQPEERYTGLSPATVVSQLRRSKLVTVSAPEGGQVGRPAAGTATLSGASSGPAVGAPAYLGDEKAGTGLAGLATHDLVTMVLSPDLMASLAAGSMSATDVAAVQTAMVDHCEQLGDRMAILDPPLFDPQGDGSASLSPQECSAWRDGLTSSPFATLYYPWLRVVDPVTGVESVEPPSGFIAGTWARNDAELGVSSAPTGRVRHAIGLVRQLTDVEQGPLNVQGVCCLRVFRGSGPTVWGARTMAPPESEWRYLNVRRLFNYIEESVVEGTRFAVFAPNDRVLWARLRRSVTAFLLGLWRNGALVGTTAEQAFYVKCDEETNPQDQVDQGIAVVEMGVAPVKPAEFIVIRIRQTSSGAEVAE